MKRFFFLLVLVIVGGVLFPSLVRASDEMVAESSARLKKEERKKEWLDSRFIILGAYLREKNSPLADHVWEFILTSDSYQIDWRLLPAISGLESNYGKRIIPGSFNAYGWGGGYIRFKSWPESIRYLAAQMRERYYNRGLWEPERIGLIYAPPNPSWGKLVRRLMEEISS